MNDGGWDSVFAVIGAVALAALMGRIFLGHIRGRRGGGED